MRHDIPLQERGVSRLLGWSLEEVGGRTALLAGAVERHAGAGEGLCLDGGMAYDLSKDERCDVNREITVPDWSNDRGVCRALLRYVGYIHSG
jgi:hypothetical protein